MIESWSEASDGIDALEAEHDIYEAGAVPDEAACSDTKAFGFLRAQ
ncbi:hypothetical protein BH09MYX1_BH09MYX1_24930 [soil metagenome]